MILDIALCINVARAHLSLSTMPSDIFEAISPKFVRTRTPNSHVEVRRPISAHGENYMTSLANSPIESIYNKSTSAVMSNNSTFKWFQTTVRVCQRRISSRFFPWGKPRRMHCISSLALLQSEGGKQTKTNALHIFIGTIAVGGWETNQDECIAYLHWHYCSWRAGKNPTISTSLQDPNKNFHILWGTFKCVIKYLTRRLT